MKKIIIMLVCIMLFSGCQGSLSQIERFGTEYSSEEKYIAMLPNGISIPMTYDDVLGLKGESQYSPNDLPYSGELFYDETFLDRQCILGFSFENGKVKELAYIYECENETEKEKETKYIYKCFKNCYGNSNNELDSLNNYVPWKDMYLDDHIYATWKHTYIDNYTVELLTQSNSNIIVCTISFSNNVAGIEEETTTYSYTTTTTAYEWKLNTDSTGYDWISVNNTEKEVWCSNSIAAWRLMGYDIPDGISTKSMVKAIDKLYEDETYLKYDLATISEMFAIANDIY